MSLTSDHALAPALSASAEETEIAGRSLTQIAWSRLRRDKVAMISLATVLFYILVAALAPLVTKIVGVNPYDFD